MTHGPVAGLILQQARVNGFTESSFTSLSFDEQIRNSEVGVLGYQVRLDWGKWHPFVQLAWDHEFDLIATASLTTIVAPAICCRPWCWPEIGELQPLGRTRVLWRKGSIVKAT